MGGAASKTKRRQQDQSRQKAGKQRAGAPAEKLKATDLHAKCRAFAPLAVSYRPCEALILQDYLNVYQKCYNIAEFRLAGAQNCRFVITAPLLSATLDDVSSSYIVLSACSQSVFIRNCRQSRLALIAAQTRLRDVKDCALFCWSQTGVVFEGCSGVRLSSFLVQVGDDAQEVEALKREVLENLRVCGVLCQHAFEVHNFTPAEAQICVEEVAALGRASAAWEFPPVATQRELASPKYSNLGVPCVFRSQLQQYQTLINCSAEAAEVLASQVFAARTGLRCVRYVASAQNTQPRGVKSVFACYCLLEGRAGAEEALQSFGIGQQALVCDDVDAAAFRAAFQ